MTAKRSRARVERRRAFDHRFLHVDLVTVRRGGREHTYIHGGGPDIAFVVPVWDDGTVTLNRQVRFGLARPSIEVPGGHVDPGETPLAAARRELREETGITARRMTRLRTFIPSIKIQQSVHAFVAQGLTQGPPALEDDEEIETIRIPLDDAIRRAQRGWMVHAPSMLALFLARERLAR